MLAHPQPRATLWWNLALQVKLPLYARHGIPEVWIIDAQSAQILLFHTLQGAGYAYSSCTPAPGRIALQALPGPTADLTGLFED